MTALNEKFEQIFNDYQKFSKEVLDELFSLLTIISVNREVNIIKQGKPDTKDYFLLKGILREYSIYYNDEEVTLKFYNKESIITPNFCRTNKGISISSIQALSECTIGFIEATELEKIRDKNSEFF